MKGLLPDCKRSLCHLDNPFGEWQSGPVSVQKMEQLRELIGSYGSCLVAYSGGVDSVFLARVAAEVLGDKALAVIADSPSLPRGEFQEALEIAGGFQITVRVVTTGEISIRKYMV